MAPEAQQSYVRFMREYLFDHIDIPKENIHIPDGTLPIHLLEEYCRQYENRIDDYGGIDIQLLGIGRTGHIGFNEPGSWENSPTRLVRLDSLTRRDAVKDFQREELVPYRALTMGIGTILKARAIYLMAWGSYKAAFVQEAAEGPVNAGVPVTYLQKHPNTKVYVDLAAAQELTRFKSPCQVGMCHWDDDLVCKAVVWLTQKTGKPILKLTDEDYSKHNLSELIIEHDNSYNINIKIFNRLQHTITGWPGGKPNSDDTHRPERAEPARKRVVIFSPHPDDDVISMGGTFLRLVEQGHEVHVAYQTSGNIAVHDYDALRFMEFFKEFEEVAGQEAFRRQQEASWMKDCRLWLYRGAWHEWSVDEIEMAVPLSPQQLEKKRRTIFMHQSQKDQPPFPGEDTREFWQRAEDRNRNTALQYRALGLAEYEAMEAFRRWRG